MFGKNKEHKSVSQTDTPQTDAADVGVRFFTMPPAFRHLDPSVMRKPESSSPATRPAEQPPVVPRPLSAPGKPQALQPGRPSSMKKWMMISGGMLLVVLAVGGYFLLRNDEAVQPRTPVIPVPVAPPVQTSTPPKQEEPPSSPVQTPPASSPPFSTAAVPGADADSDGLTDVEEQLLYGTNSRLPDTDKDGFLDGNEVFHGYDPVRDQPAILKGSDHMREYQAEGFVFGYPRTWSIQPRSGTTDLLVVSTTGESFSLSVEEKIPTVPLADWYATRASREKVSAKQTKGGLNMLQTEDGLNAYLELDQKVLIVGYHRGVKGTVEYLQTFQMFLNSVVEQ